MIYRIYQTGYIISSDLNLFDMHVCPPQTATQVAAIEVGGEKCHAEATITAV